jgi:hypothetical protein
MSFGSFWPCLPSERSAAPITATPLPPLSAEMSLYLKNRLGVLEFEAIPLHDRVVDQLWPDLNSLPVDSTRPIVKGVFKNGNTFIACTFTSIKKNMPRNTFIVMVQNHRYKPTIPRSWETYLYEKNGKKTQLSTFITNPPTPLHHTLSSQERLFVLIEHDEMRKKTLDQLFEILKNLVNQRAWEFDSSLNHRLSL